LVAAAVFPLKNVSQLAVIWFTAAAGADVGVGDGLVTDEAEGLLAGGEVEPPLEQAASVTAGIASIIAR
jgi:hypothetical protein